MTDRKQTTRITAEGAEPDVGDMTDGARIAALLPEELLQPGEIVILMLKPSPLFIVLAPLRTLVVIVIGALIAWQLTFTPLLDVSRQDIVLLAAGLLILRLFWQFLEWMCRVYVLTDRRVIRVKGVVQVEVFETSLKDIQHTQASYSLRERLFGLGTIAFATAGTGLAEAYWLMVANPLQVHQTVVRALQRYR
jgi:uncharacterized membrane protein YdbT with pleckstrin-like domain